MKTVIKILLFIIAVSTNIIAQNKIDPLDTLGLPIIHNNPNIFNRDNNFIIGWNYGGPGRAMDSLMKSNTN